ncbi:MAG: hypothetical protein KME64_25700 [Scytonematopsis contorta HA4267-MV1]|jgi:hypothetical protein|nr:hypothetical protein [Scytonematopsis contorta HA4267-MV1]
MVTSRQIDEDLLYPSGDGKPMADNTETLHVTSLHFLGFIKKYTIFELKEDIMMGYGALYLSRTILNFSAPNPSY